VKATYYIYNAYDGVDIHIAINFPGNTQINAYNRNDKKIEINDIL